jgi:hypothetical protein
VIERRRKKHKVGEGKSEKVLQSSLFLGKLASVSAI